MKEVLTLMCPFVTLEFIISVQLRSLAYWQEWLTDFSPRPSRPGFRHRKWQIYRHCWPVCQSWPLRKCWRCTEGKQPQLKVQQQKSPPWMRHLKRRDNSEITHNGICDNMLTNIFLRTRKDQQFSGGHCGRDHGGHFAPRRSRCHFVSLSLFTFCLRYFSFVWKFKPHGSFNICNGRQAIRTRCETVVIVAIAQIIRADAAALCLVGGSSPGAQRHHNGDRWGFARALTHKKQLISSKQCEIKL